MLQEFGFGEIGPLVFLILVGAGLLARHLRRPRHKPDWKWPWEE